MYNREILDAIYACRDGEMNMTRCAVYVCLAKYAQDDGTGIFPGIDLIASHAKCHEKTVRRVIAWLLSNGYLIADGTVGYHVNRYKIGMGKLGLEVKEAANKPKVRKPPRLEAIPSGEELAAPLPLREELVELQQNWERYQRAHANNPELAKRIYPKAQQWRETLQKEGILV